MWYVCTMDGGVLSKHPTKREAVHSITHQHGEESIRARRVRAGDYEYTTGGGSRGVCETYWVMDEPTTRRHAFFGDA